MTGAHATPTQKPLTRIHMTSVAAAASATTAAIARDYSTAIFGVTAYAMITRKGATHLPLVRGTGFLVRYSIVAFYNHHVVTAAHLLKPTKYRELYGSPRVMESIGERHISHKLLRFTDDGFRAAALPLLPGGPTTFANMDVGVSRIEREMDIFPQMRRDGLPPIPAFELDVSPIHNGELVTLLGMDLLKDEDVADTATMTPRAVEAVCRGRMTTDQFGPVVLVAGASSVPDNGTLSPQRAQAADDGDGGKVDPGPLISGGMVGGPVIRKSNGKCVGILVAPCRRTRHLTDEKIWRDRLERASKPLPKTVEDAEKGKIDVQSMAKDFFEANRQLLTDPYLDISSNTALLNAVAGPMAAFVGAGEFEAALRRTEII